MVQERSAVNDIIRNVAVFDGTTLLAGRLDVTLEAGRIAAVAPTGAGRIPGTVVDGTGATLLPGFIDGHVHFFRPPEFTQLTNAGVTSAADMGTWPVTHVTALKAASNGFTFLTAGAPLIGPAGPHAHMPGLADAIISTPEEARRAVAQRAGEGVDYIKLVLESAGRGGPDRATAAAAVHAAHAAQLRIVAHASAIGAIELGVEVGVDILTHAPLDETAGPDLVDRIVRAGTVVVPTLIMMRTIARNHGLGDAYGHARRFVRDLHAAGAVLAAGTDANAAPGAPAMVPHGRGLHEELQLLVDAGLTPLEALRTTTGAAAAVFGWKDRGRVIPGLRADLVLIHGEPVNEITAIQNVRNVWQAGQQIRRP